MYVHVVVWAWLCAFIRRSGNVKPWIQMHKYRYVNSMDANVQCSLGEPTWASYRNYMRASLCNTQSHTPPHTTHTHYSHHHTLLVSPHTAHTHYSHTPPHTTHTHHAHVHTPQHNTHTIHAYHTTYILYTLHTPHHYTQCAQSYPCTCIPHHTTHTHTHTHQPIIHTLHSGIH